MHFVALVPWVVFATVWIVGAWFSNETIKRESRLARLSYSLPLAVAAFILFSAKTRDAFPFLLDHVLPGNKGFWWLGVVFEYVGIAFAVWARFTLGRLWSGTITLKKDHRLVREGPFSITRHPIYSGALFAILGTAMIDGSVRAFILFAFVVGGFVFKLSKEEALMAAQFGDEHRAYRARVRRLIPFVW